MSVHSELKSVDTVRLHRLIGDTPRGRLVAAGGIAAGLGFVAGPLSWAGLFGLIAAAAIAASRFAGAAQAVENAAASDTPSLTPPQASAPELPAITPEEEAAPAVGVTAHPEEEDRHVEHLETLKDVHWEISENEARLRAVLDAQSDVILRRDLDGRLTFVNNAFARVFGRDGASVLGTAFAPEVLASDANEDPSRPFGDPIRVRLELMDTVDGPRWFAWEEQRVAGTSELQEMQCVGRDVTAQRQADLDLKEARDLAEEANRAKSRFLAAMSHEIRTPMNGILGMASLLADTPMSPDQETYVRAVDQSARTLLSLIDEILDFSRIEAGKLVLEKAPFSLSDTVQSVVELLAPGAEEKGLEIAWDVDPLCSGTFVGDETRLRQILLNIIANAVKFTDKGGVAVRVAQAPAADASLAARIRISVEDTGIGLSAEERGRVFAEFEQAEAAIRRRRGGTGLGLAISMSLARAMNGNITVASTPGEGSVFQVELALEPVAGAHLASPAVAQEAAHINVLIVGERVLERQMLADSLRSRGVRVAETQLADAGRIVEAAATAGAPINRVILEGDYEPKGAGELMGLVESKLGGSRDVRGIVLVGALGRPSLARFRNYGFDAFLIRPVRPQSLLTQLGIRFGRGIRTSPISYEPRQVEACQDGERRNYRILLAEDNAINALLAVRMLDKAGCVVTHVKDGTGAVSAVEGLLAAGEPMFDLVLMDIHMPRLDGIEATRAIKVLFEGEHGERECPPIVALTANAFAEDRDAYLTAGMSDYLSKPFDTEALRRMLVRWLPQIRSRQPNTSAA